MSATTATDFSRFETPRPTLQYFLLNVVTASLFSVWWQVNLVKELNRQLGSERCDIRWYWGLMILVSWVSLPCLYTGTVGIPAFISLFGILYFWISFALSVTAAMNELLERSGIPVRASRLWTVLFGTLYQYYLLHNLEPLAGNPTVSQGDA